MLQIIKLRNINEMISLLKIRVGLQVNDLDMSAMKKLSLVLAFLLSAYVPSVQAQQVQIIPADDGTATLVTPDGQRFIIDGGKLSKDGKNLFHSFREFGLNPNQIATFLANPHIKNILSRVVGGNASYINGLLEVSGGNANLYLVNPAGIVFGAGARLNIGGDFTATTSHQLGFANGVFNAIGPNDYLNLVGNPNTFQLSEGSGDIINAGVLEVAPNHNISLVGSNVINTGTINAPGGRITIASVAGTSNVKISQEGQILSLEITPPQDAQGNPLGIKAVDLPTLLTGAANAGVETGLAVTPTGTVQQVSTGVDIPTQEGTTIVSGTVNTASALGGEISILGDRVGLVNATVDASGINGGGIILVGGDYQGNGIVPNATATYVSSDSVIKADALTQGNGGKVIVWGNEITAFGGDITAQGGALGGDGGFVEVSGKDNLIFTGYVDVSAPQGNWGTLLLDPNNITISSYPSSGGVDASLPQILSDEFVGQDITISASVLGSQTADIILEASNDITFNNSVNITTAGVDLTARANRSITVNNEVNITTNNGDVILNADRDGINGGAIRLNPGSSINSNGGDIILGGGTDPLSQPAVGTTAKGIGIDNPAGIALNNSTLNSDGGNISLRGEGRSVSTDRNDGIFLDNSLLEATGTGTISLNGTGGIGAGGDSGIRLAGAEVTSENGDIILRGTGGGSGTRSDGILLELNSTIQSTGIGTISLEGTGAPGGQENSGIDIRGTSTVTSVDGNIILRGTGGSGTGIQNEGIILTDQSTIRSNGNGAITLEGTGGAGTGDNHYGIIIGTDPNQLGSIRNSQVISENGDITLVGTGGGNGNAIGILLQDNGNITSDQGSNIQLEGRAAGTEINSIVSNGTITTTGTTTIVGNNGNVVLDNSGSDGVGNFGTVEVISGNNVTLTDTGNISLGNVTATTLNVNAPLTVGNSNRTVEINTTDSQVYNSAVTLGGNANFSTPQSITFNSSLGIQNFTANFNVDNRITLPTSGVSGTGIVSISPLTAGRGINISTGGTEVLVLNNLDSLSPSVSQLNIGDTQTGIITVNNTVTFNNPVTFTTGNEFVATQPIFTRGRDFTVNATKITTLGINTNNGATAGNIRLNSTQSGISTGELNTSAFPATLSGATAGDIELNSATDILTGNLNASASGGKAGDVTINPTTTATIQGNVTAGTLTAEKPLTFTNSDITVNTTGTQEYKDNVTFNNPATLTGSDVIARGNVTGTTLNVNAPLTVGNSTETRTINTIGSQTYNNPVTLEGDTKFSTPESITFDDSLIVNNHALTLIADDTITFPLSPNTVTVTPGATVAIETYSPDGNILLGNPPSTTEALRITNLDTLTDLEELKIGSQNTGTLTISAPITFYDPVTLQARNININASITGEDNASITLIGSGTTTTLNDNIITRGNAIAIRDNVLVGDNISLDTTYDGEIASGADIEITGTINDYNTSPSSLTFIAGDTGNVTLNGQVGNTQALNALTVSSAAQTNLNGNLIKTTGNQTYQSPIVTQTNPLALISEGTVTTGNIQSTGAAVDINAQTITTGNITTSANQGGSITLNSQTSLTTGTINASGIAGNAGNVNLNATRDIEVSSIDGRSSGGSGGNVNVITTGNVRITNTIPNTNASVSTAGSPGGPITIKFDGDPNIPINNRIPFIVGDPRVNGSAGEITSGGSNINSGDFVFTERQGNVAIVSVEEPTIDYTESVGNVVATSPAPLQTEVTAVPRVIPTITIDQVKDVLQNIEQVTSEKPAIIYVSFRPRGLNLGSDISSREAALTQEYQASLNLEENLGQPTITAPPEDNQELDILVVTNEGEPIHIPIKGVTRKQVVEEAEKLYLAASDKTSSREQYEEPARKLYQWLIGSAETTLNEQKINNLLFVMPTGLRIIPIAALIDSEGQFLVKKYSSGFAPSISLNNNAYKDIRQQQLLALGASEFADTNALGPLPAVKVELPTIYKIWESRDYLLNESFTVDNLRASRQKTTFGIIHLATHGEFKPGDLSSSYIQFYDRRLTIDEVRTLGLNNPPLELLVLSACRTAFGDENIELGFAGLAVKAGVKSVLASLWWVGDTGTLAFMADFYSNLRTEDVPIKAEAVRRTQVNMIEGRTRLDGGQIINAQGEVTLPSELANAEPPDLSHPYYWAPFTLIGNPW
ncbi:MAG: CHAT domain-containing protein [Microcystis aeruginosa G13-07]|jgi:filamentous hemagglutinin family protein|nr:CHAT domain-containing protein [Microcystis aeruginosa G13-07]